ncbi:MAG: hypothetical protein V1754_05425, partial [Pseudomonadota bacterium]
GNHKLALNHFNSALKLAPNAPEIMIELAETYAKNAEYKISYQFGLRAINIFQRKKQTGCVADALLRMGRLFAKGDTSSRRMAIKLLEKAAKSKQDVSSEVFVLLEQLYPKRTPRAEPTVDLNDNSIYEPKNAKTNRQLPFYGQGQPDEPKKNAASNNPSYYGQDYKSKLKEPNDNDSDRETDSLSGPEDYEKTGQSLPQEQEPPSEPTP